MSKDMALLAKSSDVLMLPHFHDFMGVYNLYNYTIGNCDALPLFAQGQRVLIDTADRFPTPPGVFALFNGSDHGLYRLETLHRHWPPACWLSRLAAPDTQRVVALSKLRVFGRLLPGHAAGPGER